VQRIIRVPNPDSVLPSLTGSQCHGVAVPRARVCRCAGEVGAAVTAGGEHSVVRVDAVDCTVFHVETHHAHTAPVLPPDQRV